MENGARRGEDRRLLGITWAVDAFQELWGLPWGRPRPDNPYIPTVSLCELPCGLVRFLLDVVPLHWKTILRRHLPPLSLPRELHNAQKSARHRRQVPWERQACQSVGTSTLVVPNEPDQTPFNRRAETLICHQGLQLSLAERLVEGALRRDDLQLVPCHRRRGPDTRCSSSEPTRTKSANAALLRFTISRVVALRGPYAVCHSIAGASMRSTVKNDTFRTPRSVPDIQDQSTPASSTSRPATAPLTGFQLVGESGIGGGIFVEQLPHRAHEFARLVPGHPLLH